MAFEITIKTKVTLDSKLNQVINQLNKNKENIRNGLSKSSEILNDYYGPPNMPVSGFGLIGVGGYIGRMGYGLYDDYTNEF